MTMGSISEAINEFGLSIFKELNSTSNATNIFFSPMSISAALCMVLLGANGNTASQIEKVLHLPQLKGAASSSTRGNAKRRKYGKLSVKEAQKKKACQCTGVQVPVAEVHSQFQALLSKLTSLTNQAELKIANGMFGQKKFNFEDQYLSSAQLLYQAKLESVDFENAAEETRQKINEWVESQTQGKIKDMFSKDSIDAATSLILVNAIYFKGKWNKQFREEKTKEAPFYVNKDVVKSVQMMNQNDTFNLGVIEELNARILQLPYGEGDLSMFILLTDEMTGLEKIEQEVSSKSLAEWTNSKHLRKTKVNIYLPRFKIEESSNLGPHLINMGIIDAFSQRKS
ncbi:serpin B13-like isoform X2 [Ascaphus truei]|uniref:serpin B13-like isoform X2 n=1 Tax=Ascaphus truei TaxID=8439 RepID=UPI003F5A03CE